MKQGWEYKKLGEVASYINGYAFKPDQWREEGTPIVRIQNLNNSDAPYNYYDGEVPEKVIINNGDLLISWSASLGAYIWQGGRAFLNQHIFKVSFDKTDIDKMYLKYAITSKLDAMATQVHGATMKHIVKKDFDNILIPYPPLSIQQSIVSELDKINELIRLKKEQLSDYDKLAQSLFYEMFGDPVDNEKGWEVKKLGEVCELKAGKAIKANELAEDNEFPCYGGNGIRGFINKCSHHYSAPIIGRQGAYCGTVNFAEAPFYATEHAVVVKPLITMELKWLYYTLIKLNLSRFAKGQAQPGIAVGNLNEYVNIPLPPLSLQQLFAQRIELIEKQKAEIKSTIQDLETLLASRMQYWFE